jgi:hypothetical protein
LVLGVSCQEGSTHSRIVQERGPDVGRDFLEKDDIRRFRSLEDMAEMSLARETGREEKASMFHDMRESLCVQKVSMFRDVRESLCVTWLCAFPKGMGAHIRVEWLKAERVRQSLLVTIGV